MRKMRGKSEIGRMAKMRKKRGESKTPNQIFQQQRGKMSKSRKTKKPPKILFYKLLFNGKVIQKVSPISQQNHSSYKIKYFSFLLKFALSLQFDEGKKRENLRHMCQVMIPVVTKEREVMLRKNINY